MRQQRGFTLLELLVTLAIVGLLAGLILPNAVAWIGASERAAQQRQFSSAFARLPLRAFMDRREFVIGQWGDSAQPAAVPDIRLPEGWRVTFDPPLRVSFVGLCSDAAGSVATPSGIRRVRVAAPDCVVTFEQ